MSIGIGAVLAIVEWENSKQHKDVTLMIENERVGKKIFVYEKDHQVYLSYNIVKAYIDPSVHMHSNGRVLGIDLKDKKFLLEDDQLSWVKDSIQQIYIPIKKIENEPFVPVSLLSRIWNIDVHYGKEQNILMIDDLDKPFRVGEVLKSSSVKKSLFKKQEVKKGDRVRVYKEEDQYYEVRSDQGIVGKINKEDIKIIPIKKLIPINVKRKDWNIENQKISLVWEYVHSGSYDMKDQSKTQGLDVLAPTWFSVVDETGTLENKANIHYVKDAHKKGYKVWGLVDNSFDPNITHVILNDENVQKKVIAQIILYVSLYDLDGVNIDFENIYYEDQSVLVEFVKRLKESLQKQNVLLSMDITIPSTSGRWSRVYDRKNLGEILDYVAVMAYDEHWSSSPVSGSVASIPWVEKGIIDSLESIPKDKMLLGIPFYTRLWKEENQNGEVKVSSRAISMNNVQQILEDKKLNPQWKSDLGQYYVEYKENEATFKIWIEDDRSIARKIRLMKEYDLAGIAAWRKDYETYSIWNVIKRMIKDQQTYTELGYES